MDQLRIGDVLGDLADGRYRPLEILDAPVLAIRTDDGEVPDIGTIRSFVSGPSAGR